MASGEWPTSLADGLPAGQRLRTDRPTLSARGASRQGKSRTRQGRPVGRPDSAPEVKQRLDCSHLTCLQATLAARPSCRKVPLANEVGRSLRIPSDLPVGHPCRQALLPIGPLANEVGRLLWFPFRPADRPFADAVSHSRVRHSPAKPACSLSLFSPFVLPSPPMPPVPLPQLLLPPS